MTRPPVHFLVTAGPTREFLDPVRFISNRSSGKMGYAIATAAREAGGDVILVSGPTALAAPSGVPTISVVSAQEMADAVLSRFDQSDVVIMAAAVCDFRPRQVAPHKLKKQTIGGMLELEPTIDILAELGRRKSKQIIVGFAVETENLAQYGRDKLRRKGADLLVANTTEAFDRETNQVILLGNDGATDLLPEMTKTQLAALIIERALRLVA